MSDPIDRGHGMWLHTCAIGRHESPANLGKSLLRGGRIPDQKGSGRVRSLPITAEVVRAAMKT